MAIITKIRSPVPARNDLRHSHRKVEYQRWRDEVTTSIVAGTYIDPAAGRITLRRFYDGWSARQLWVTKTRQNADLTVASVTFADMPLQTIRRSHVEAWNKSASEVLAATRVKTRNLILRSVRTAVDDRVIAHDHAVGITLPRRRRADAALRIPTVAEVGAVLAHADSGRTSTREG